MMVTRRACRRKPPEVMGSATTSRAVNAPSGAAFSLRHAAARSARHGTTKGVADGTLTARQATNDERRDANIILRESTDEAKHNGHLTRAETRRLNHAENRNSCAIHRQRH
ncbi:hypothetical protein [Rhodanobacter thiooxydans]|uniref:hypothetical protein n=1 Tax=Rhodanobacter thiooxydans TaxID=416169 RepID=UPI00256F051B|nr:hypothetical protein [Rhodanobacter thiooxydans]